MFSFVTIIKWLYIYFLTNIKTVNNNETPTEKTNEGIFNGKKNSNITAIKTPKREIKNI